MSQNLSQNLIFESITFWNRFWKITFGKGFGINNLINFSNSMPAVINFRVSALINRISKQSIHFNLSCALKNYDNWTWIPFWMVHSRTKNHFRTLHWSVTVSIKGSKNFEISKNFRLMTTMVIRSTFCYVWNELKIFAWHNHYLLAKYNELWFVEIT